VSFAYPDIESAEITEYELYVSLVGLSQTMYLGPTKSDACLRSESSCSARSNFEGAERAV